MCWKEAATKQTMQNGTNAIPRCGFSGPLFSWEQICNFFLLVEDHDRHAGPITASARQSSNSAEPSHFLGNVGGSLCALAEGVLADLQIESGVSAKREDRTDRRELLTDGEPWVSPRKGKTRQ